MKKLLVLLFLQFIWIKAYSQYPVLKVSERKTNSITKEALIADLDDYKSDISKLHVHPFTHIKRKDFYRKIDSIKVHADDYNVDQLLIEILKVNAMIEDEHTNILYSGRDVFPFKCYWFEEGIYITQTEAQYSKYLFSKIIAINKIPIEDVVKRITPLLADRNPQNIKYEVPKYIFDPFTLHGLQISETRDKATYTIITQKNDTIDFQPEIVDRNKMNLQDNGRERQRKDFPYWYTEKENVIYFNYSSCYDSKETPFNAFEKELTKTLEEKKPQKLIIDLRDNRGGYPRQLEHFIEYLRRSRLNKTGRLYVLIGRKTFSAAIMNTIALKNDTYARIIGEETSGSTEFYGGVKYQLLPKTKLQLAYSTAFWPSEERYTGSLRPDVFIPERLSDYISGADSARKYVMSH